MVTPIGYNLTHIGISSCIGFILGSTFIHYYKKKTNNDQYTLVNVNKLHKKIYVMENYRWDAHDIHIIKDTIPELLVADIIDPKDK